MQPVKSAVVESLTNTIMNLVQIKSGKANMAHSLSECYVFFTPRPSVDGANCVETFIGKAAKDFRSKMDAPIREYGNLLVVPSLSDMPAEIGGQFGQGTYQIRDGVILKIVCKKRVGWAATMKTAVQFIKVRENAAMRQLKFTPQPSNALAMDWLGVQGRFDVISLLEAEAFGAMINPAARKLSELTDNELIEITTIEPEIVAPVAMVAVGNEGKLMPTLKRRRKIRKV